MENSLFGFSLLRQIPTNSVSVQRWLALPEGSNDMVMLSLLQVDQGLRDDHLERFMRQASICAQLKHPGLPRFLAQGYTNNTLWFASEPVEGVPLSQIGSEFGPLSLHIILEIMKQILDIVMYLHKLDVVHRSLQPDSFYIKKSLETTKLYLTDLGDAKCFSSIALQRVTSPGQRGYNVNEYTAPESLINFKHLDPRGDIYSIGAIMYFLLTEHPPYGLAEPSIEQITTAVLGSEPKQLSQVRTDLPESIIGFVERAMQRKRDMRFSSLADMITTFDQLSAIDGKPNLDDTLTEKRRSRVFISYSHTDAEWLKRLLVHLEPLQQTAAIDTWVDEMILPGANWREEINSALRSSRIAILLVSADFLASDFIMNYELPTLIDAANERGLVIIPIIVKPCRFLDTPMLSKYQTLNSPASPLIGMSEMDQERVFVRLVESVNKYL